MTIRKKSVTVITDADGDGVGKINFGGNSTWAKLVMLKLDYIGADAGTDVAITDGSLSPDPGKEVYAKDNSNTDFGPKLMSEAVYGADGAADGADGVDNPVVLGPLTVTVADGGDTKTVKVDAWLAY